jgi:hypothetical protein
MKPIFKDDELNDVKTPVTTAATANPAAAVVQPLTPTQVVDDDDAVDLIGDYEALKSKPGLPCILPKEQGKTVRFALVKGVKAFVKQTHFLAGVNGKGCTVICPGGDCPECKKGGDHASRRKVVALAIKYETNGDGKFAADTTKPSLSVGFVNLSPTAYTELSDCPSEGEDLYSVDFKVSKKTNGIGWTFNRMSSPPSYLKAQMEAEVAELVAPYLDGKVLKSRLGKVVSPIEMRVLLFGSAADESPTLNDLEVLD